MDMLLLKTVLLKDIHWQGNAHNILTKLIYGYKILCMVSFFGRKVCKFLSICMHMFIYKFKFFTRKIKKVKTKVLKVAISKCCSNSFSP